MGEGDVCGDDMRGFEGATAKELDDCDGSGEAFRAAGESPADMAPNWILLPGDFPCVAAPFMVTDGFRA